MIGDMIAKVRKEKGMAKTELAEITGINIGHLTHIEKGERNPSHKALKNICKALDIPYQQLMYTYDKQISEKGADGKKHVIEKSVFTRGNKIIVTGIRDGENEFRAKTYKNTPYHHVELITSIDNGIITTHSRINEE